MHIKSGTSRLRPARIARSVVAMVLAFAFLSSFAPHGSTSSVQLCVMECCAFRPPHAAGSCTHGACQAVLSAPTPALPSPQEELCGAHNKKMTPQRSETHRHDAAMLMPADADAAAPPAENSSTPTHAHEHSTGSTAKRSTPESAPPDATSVRAFAKPCPPECGAGTCGSSTQSRPRDDAALAYVDKPRPPSRPSHSQSSVNPDAALAALCRRSRPRGPPSFFS